MIKNILLAEDDTGTALFIKTKLEEHGYEVAVARNGRVALEMLERQPVDLLITDVVMPEMDGVDLYQAVKADERTAHLPIIIVTDKEVFIESFSALGVQHFVAKSSPVHAYLDRIRQIESNGQQARQFHKVLVGGTHQFAVEQMQGVLRERNCLVSTADASIDIISKAFLMTPDVILLDLFMKDAVTTRELIRALRCLDFLKKTRIVVYAHFTPDQIGGATYLLDGLQEEVEAAIQAGAVKYIGRFSPVTFADQMGEFGIV